MTRDKTFQYQGVDSYKVEPYFANLSVIGMLDHATDANLKVAQKWIEWYFEHLNAPDYNGLNGTIYVYYVDIATRNNYTSSKYYDSTDSYAGTFLTLLEKYIREGGDKKVLTMNKTKIKQIADAMLSTMDVNGLTLAKPDYAIKYLMDNSEVYEGLRSVAWLTRNIWKDETLAQSYEAKQLVNFNGIETLWDNVANNFKAYEGAGTTNFVYNKTGLTSFSAKIYEFGADLTKVKFYSSPNGSTWTLISSTHDTLVATQSNWYRTNFTNTGTIPAGTNYLKVEFTSTFASYDTELSQITIN